MSWLRRNTPKSDKWSLAGRLKSRITFISVAALLFVTATVTAHYGRDIPELQQRTAFDLATEIAADLPVDKTGEQLRASINHRHALFLRFPEAYEWYVMDGDGTIISASVETPIDREKFPPGLPPAEWDAPSSKGGWEAGKTFEIKGETRHIVAVAHADPAGLLIGLAMGEAFMHIILPLVPFTALITVFVSRTVRRTLLPLQSLAEQARRVQTTADIQPLDPKDAPAEVVDLVNALNFSLQKLHESIEAEKRFLQDAAHALRTPLAIVKARLELDGDSINKASLLEEVDGLTRLAAQLLASANAERLVLKSDARADIAMLAKDVVSNMTPLAIRAGVDLGFSDEGGGPSLVRGDADAISHALKNLIENALKFTPRGRSVTVHVAHNPPVIAVSDEGPGVPAGKEEAIFSRHSRGKFGDGSGAGLGLSIVRRIMHAHGGTADLARTDAAGATFRLSFPGAAGEAAGASPALPPTANDQGPPGKRAAA
jgi:signal transduction histidine kinase